MTVTEWNSEEFEHRLRRAARPGPHCLCGKPMTTSACVNCGQYLVDVPEKLLGFLTGESRGLDMDLLRALAQQAAKVPILESKIEDMTNRLDILETQRDPKWLRWLNRGLTAIAVLEWLRRLLEFLHIRRRRTS